MFSARGKLLLFADADGASKFRDIEKLEAELKQLNNKVVIIKYLVSVFFQYYFSII